jgi:hypothetical protein
LEESIAGMDVAEGKEVPVGIEEHQQVESFFFWKGCETVSRREAAAAREADDGKQRLVERLLLQGMLLSEVGCCWKKGCALKGSSC